MEKKIIKRGNGAAIPMTKDMLDLLGVAEGDAVRVRFEGRRMIVTPLVGRRAARSMRVSDGSLSFEDASRLLRDVIV